MKSTLFPPNSTAESLPSKVVLTLLLTLLVVPASLVPARLVAGDWPDLLGPMRNGVAEGETLLREWPDGGPREAWSVKIGAGYSGATVRGDRVVVFHRQGDEEVLEAYRASDGQRIWRAAFPASYRGGINPDRGPRCVPIIDGERVYAFGAAGDMHCVTLDRGATVWSRALGRDYRALDGYFGFGSTPVVADERLLVNLGGRDGAGLVALDLKDGTTSWKATAEGASYSSPAVAEIGGRRLAVFLTRLNLVGVDPQSGREHLRFPFGERGPTVNAATPLVQGSQIFLSASYGIGAVLLECKSGTPEPIWAGDEQMSSQYTTCVPSGGVLYGVHGREDAPGSSLRCLDQSTGRVRWQQTYPVAHLIRAGDLLLVQQYNGRIELVQANPDAYRSLGVGNLGGDEVVTRALPALSGGRWFVRTSDDEASRLICLQVGN